MPANPRKTRVRSVRSVKKMQPAKVPIAQDAIPAIAIRISDAFESVQLELQRNRDPLESIPDDYKGNLYHTIQNQDELHEDDRIELEVIEAAFLFRLALAEELRTYIRDPKTGEKLELRREDWFFQYPHVPTDFDDWISQDMPGPAGTIVHGERRPIFLDRAEFESWINYTFLNQKAGAIETAAAKTRSGWQIADTPLHTEMENLICAGHAKSVEDAARNVASKAQGHGTITAKQTRLAKGYRLWKKRSES